MSFGKSIVVTTEGVQGGEFPNMTVVVGWFLLVCREEKGLLPLELEVFWSTLADMRCPAEVWWLYRLDSLRPSFRYCIRRGWPMRLRCPILRTHSYLSSSLLFFFFCFSFSFIAPHSLDVVPRQNMPTAKSISNLCTYITQVQGFMPRSLTASLVSQGTRLP